MSDKSPDAFRTISEVADWLGVQPHVLRFWESKFSQVRPVKRAGGRRYYRPNDMLLLGGIRKLLHEDGLTIKGAQKVLREEGMSHVASLSQPLDAESAALSDLAAAAEEHAGVSQPEETGQVLDFEAARPEAEPSQPPPDTPEPVAERQMDEEAADKPQEASADTSDMADAREPDQPKTDEALEERISAEMGSTPDSPDDIDTREHTQEDAPAKAPLPSFMRDPSNRKSAAPEASDPDAPEPDQTDAAPEVAAAPTAASDRLPSFLQSRPASAEPPAPDIEDKETAPEAPGAEAEQAGPEEDHGAGTAAAGAAPEPDAPRPRIVDVPDPDESAFEVTSSALSAAFAAASLSQDRRAELLPLVAQLAALRDRMAAAQGR